MTNKVPYGKFGKKLLRGGKVAGKAIIESVNPLELVREYFDYKKTQSNNETEIARINVKRDAAVAAIEAEKDIILNYFQHRFKERSEVLDHLFSVLHTGLTSKDSQVVDRALESILGVVKDSPLKDFDTFRKARLEGKEIEI